MDSRKYILLFDGACVLCNGYVDWLLKADKKDQFRFTAQQSESGQKLVRQYNLPNDISTVVLLSPDGDVYTYSDVALKICYILGYPYRLLYPLTLIPLFIRDSVYKWIARNRYKWFGKREEACMIPDKAIRYKFLL